MKPSGKLSTVAILGVPVSSQNRGVLALGASLLNLCYDGTTPKLPILMGFHENAEPVQFRISGKPTSISLKNTRLSIRSALADHIFWILLLSISYRLVPIQAFRAAIVARNPWIAAIRDSSIVGDVRGGDSFSDIYGMRRFLLGFAMAWSVILIRGSIVQFPQTYGPYTSRTARHLARFLLKHSSTIIARDKESQAVAQALVGLKKRVLLSPDVAFSLEALVPATIKCEPPLSPGLHASQRPIGVNINGLMYNGGYTRANQFGLRMNYAAFATDLVSTLLKEHSGEVWLIPHTYGPPESVESDPEACRRVRSSLPADLQSRVRIVVGDYDCHEIKGVIGLCDFFVGSRMHSCIAALSQGIPCVGVAYSMKFRGVFESVGVENCVVDGRSADNASAIAQVVQTFRDRNSIRSRLHIRADQARAGLKQVFSELLQSASPTEMSI